MNQRFPGDRQPAFSPKDSDGERVGKRSPDVGFLFSRAVIHDKMRPELFSKAGLPEGDIALLIAGKPEAFRTKILSNVSKTRAQIILEEEQIRRPMRKRDCNEVTTRFFGILRRAWEEGKLIIDGRSDDVYV